MRTSIEPARNRIFASSPPSSMTTSASGMYFFTAVRVAYTSCTKGMCKSSARPMPAEPDTHRLARFVWGNFSWMRVSMPEAFSAIWEKCRSYSW
ncbi:unknown [Firmicutes bacterium CAG:94]|nr:unknown [Firmicutes bacterium CAG:94]